jgi:hypothetical protein
MRVRLTGALLRGRVPQEHDWADDFRASLDGVHKAARELGNIGRPRQRLPLEMARQWAAHCTQGGGGCHGCDAWASAPAEFPIYDKLIWTLLVMEAFMEASKPMIPESMSPELIFAEPMIPESMSPEPIFAEPMTCESMSPTPRMP